MNKYFMGLRLLERASNVLDNFPNHAENIEKIVINIINSSKISSLQEYYNKEIELYSKFLCYFFSEENKIEEKRYNLLQRMVDSISDTLEKMIKRQL